MVLKIKGINNTLFEQSKKLNSGFGTLFKKDVGEAAYAPETTTTGETTIYTISLKASSNYNRLIYARLLGEVKNDGGGNTYVKMYITGKGAERIIINAGPFGAGYLTYNAFDSGWVRSNLEVYDDMGMTEIYTIRLTIKSAGGGFSSWCKNLKFEILYHDELKSLE